MKFCTSLAVIAAFALPLAALADTINVTGTGVNLAPGQSDPNYTVSGPGITGAPQAVTVTPHPGWTVQNTYNTTPGGSNWVNPGPTSDGQANFPGGLYTYTTTFDLTGEIPNTAELIGSFASDNAAQVWLNGVFTGYANTYSSPFSFSSFTGFDLSSGFVAGVNTLQFVVTNGNGGSDTTGPTGLIVNINSSSVAPVPEPASIALLGTGILSVAGLARRKFRS